MDNILSIITFVPFIGMLAICCLPKTSIGLIKGVALVATGIPLVLATQLYFNYDPMAGANGGYSYVEQIDWITGIGAQYYVGVDGISMPLVWLTSILLFLGVPASFGIEKSQKAYYALLLLLEVGVFGVFIALDYFLFYVFWEIMLLPMYFLIGIWGGPRREYAAIKFFLYTLAGSVLMLIAIIALRLQMGAIPGVEHAFSIPEMVAAASSGLLTGADLPNSGFLLGMEFSTWAFWFLFVGFAIKIPVFPFHTWLPDAHVQAPTPISVILAGILLKLGGYGLMRACFPILPGAFYDNAYFLAILGVVSIVYGSFVALGQTDFKRMVAYSSVSHMGYVLLGVGAMTVWGAEGAAMQMFAHGTSSAAMFMVVGVIYDRAHHRDLNGFGGLSQPMPVYWGLTTICFFAGLGLPTMSGFIAEALTLVGAFQSDDIRFQALVLFSIIGVVITAAFLLWAIQRVFLGPLNEKYKDYPDMNFREIFCMAPLLFLCVLFGIFPNLILDVMHPSLDHLVDLLLAGGGAN